MLKIGGAALAAALAFGAATASERTGVMCPSNYAPVCGLIGGVRKTFSNSCQADVAGARIVARGACLSSSRSSVGGGSPRVEASPPWPFPW